MRWRAPADKRVVEAVISTFCDSAERSFEHLSSLNESDWARSYFWLDASGMALYFLDQLQALGIEEALPAATLGRLRDNLAHNRRRATFMFEEFTHINQEFLEAGVRFCNLKGFTLSPDSCPHPALRCQLDFDFLVDGRDLNLSRQILEKTGYALTVTTSNEWQFEAGSSAIARIEDHYKPKPQRSVELHFTCSGTAPHQPTRDERLDRLTLRAWNSQLFPVLSPTDQFNTQALHILRHLCSASTRPSWLLEYRRHMLALYHERPFWEEVQTNSLAHPGAPIAIGLATLLSTCLFGGGAPAELNEWTLDRLPDGVRLWAELYGRKAILADAPGTKLHLLLEDELTPQGHSWQNKRRSLLPLRCETRIARPSPHESLRKRVRRNYYQARFILFRLRFHVIEGLRYGIEAWRWKRQLESHQGCKRPVAAKTQPSEGYGS
jgi:Uncharacterised nucleotidyltransferase